MADYDWGQPCCGRMTGHAEACPNHPQADLRALALANNMTPVYHYGEMSSTGYIEYFECNNGCGCLVHDIDAHMKNVCRRSE